MARASLSKPLRLCIVPGMTQLRLLALFFCAAFLAACETIQMAQMGTQDQKDVTQVQQQPAEGPQPDESDRNLWNAHMDLLNRGTNPAIRY
jgi:hypothetical protein